MIASNEELLRKLRGLIEAWCDRRCLLALRAILNGYPLTSPMTDSWGELLKALQDVRAFARNELTETERGDIEECIGIVNRVLHQGQILSWIV